MPAEAAGSLARGRAAFAERRWGEAYTQLAAADRERPLDVDDLERIATAAYVTGNQDARADAFARAYNESLRRGDTKRAIGFAFWSAFGFVETGESARAEGWFMRALELVEKVQPDGVERGYLSMALAFRTLDSGDMQRAHDMFAEAVRIADEYGDRSLAAMSRQARGRTLIALGRIAEATPLLDEAMIAVTAGEVSPLFIGTVYCSVIEAFKDMYDLRRAHEWTAALSRWCETQPDMLPYRGSCLVFRAELMVLHGAWPDAMEEAQRAFEALEHLPAVGAALYQLGELHRLRGDLARAEEAFRAANATGHSAQPGLALLRLAQGKTDAAHATIGRALADARDPRERARLLPSHIEIAIAAHDLAAARDAAAELDALASRSESAYLSGIAAHARAALQLADGDPRGAVPVLRAAWAAYREIEAPYDAARVRELLGAAFHALGDDASAEMEFDAARAVFEQLEAQPDAERVIARSRGGSRGPGGLSPRELEVLTLVAKGRTNREIATELVLSEKTVARHLSNMFDKLGVSSRSALTAYAYQHGLA
jgi:DNA-binding NarL/FixJ family response regulator